MTKTFNMVILITVIIAAMDYDGQCKSNYLMAPQKVNLEQIISLKSDLFVKGILEYRKSYILSILADSIKYNNMNYSAFEFADSIVGSKIINDAVLRADFNIDSVIRIGYEIMTDNETNIAIIIEHYRYSYRRKTLQREYVDTYIVLKYAKIHGLWKVYSVDEEVK